MNLRSKLTLLFFGTLQVTFFTAVATFWAVQSSQLLADDLKLVYDHQAHLQTALDDIVPVALTATSRHRARWMPHRASAHLRRLRADAQTLEEGERVDAVSEATPATLPHAAQRLKQYYDEEVRKVRESARSVTRLSIALFFGIVTVVLASMMAYFAAIRVWLVRPLQAIGRATAIISTGNLTHRIPVSGTDEFGSLATSINDMAGTLDENQRRLVAAERFAAVGEMAAYVAHNIRNPLASIRTTAQAELLDLPRDDPRAPSFQDIVTAADRLESWVGDLLRFSSPVNLDRTLESLNALIERCAELARPLLAGRGLRLDLELAPSLPPAAVDRNKLEQVLSAVLSNAMDASPPGSAIRLVSAARAGGDHTPYACIRVEDAGSGIPPERLRTLFTLFSTTKKSGTGIGLALAQKIVTAHDGTITVTSRQGEGTVVEISLPTADRSEDRAEHSHR